MRKRGHDYRSQAVYWVRLEVVKIPEEDPAATAFSETLAQSITAVMDAVPEIEIWHMSILPDHAHIIISYRRRTPEHLDDVVTRIKTDCEHRLRSRFPQSGFLKSNKRIFAEDYTDVMIPTVPALEAVRRYCADSSRRRALRESRPRLFDTAGQLDIDGRIYTYFGNFMLLRHPFRQSVRVSRSYTPARLAKLKEEWRETARGRGVLVSPFISAAEKQVLSEALKGGAGIVRIHPCALTPGWQPEPEELELCQQGRMLIIGPTEIPAGQSSLNREKCLMLNDLARTLAEPIDSASVIAGMSS